MPGKRPSHLVRLQYFSTNKVPGETQLSLEDSVLWNASGSELGIQIPPWYSPVQLKPMYENERAKAFWDVPVYAERVMVKANRIDPRIVEKERKRVAVIEMSCPWMDNRAIKDAEKTTKYGPLRWELKQQYPGYEVKQFNIIIDVLGGWSVYVEETMKDLVEQRSRSVLRRMQKVNLSHSLNIARAFKVLMWFFFNFIIL